MMRKVMTQRSEAAQAAMMGANTEHYDPCPGVALEDGGEELLGCYLPNERLRVVLMVYLAAVAAIGLALLTGRPFLAVGGVGLSAGMTALVLTQTRTRDFPYIPVLLSTAMVGGVTELLGWTYTTAQILKILLTTTILTAGDLSPFVSLFTIAIVAWGDRLEPPMIIIPILVLALLREVIGWSVRWLNLSLTILLSVVAGGLMYSDTGLGGLATAHLIANVAGVFV